MSMTASGKGLLEAKKLPKKAIVVDRAEKTATEN